MDIQHQEAKRGGAFFIERDRDDKLPGARAAEPPERARARRRSRGL